MQYKMYIDDFPFLAEESTINAVVAGIESQGYTLDERTGSFRRIVAPQKTLDADLEQTWFGPDIYMNEVIRLEGDSLVHYIFPTWEEAEENAARWNCQCISRKWDTAFLTSHSWTRHSYGSLTGSPNYISGTFNPRRK